jgi:Sugar-binding cellulase-like
VRPLGSICCWTFAWYTHVAAGEPYADLDRAAEEARARGFDTLRVCAMPSYVSRALRTGEELRLARFAAGPSRNLRWYDFRGGVTVQPVARLIELVRAARAADLRLVLSNWDFQQAFKFEEEPDLHQQLSGLTAVDAMFAHVEQTFRDVLSLLEQHDLLDTVAVIEIMNEFESAEVGPLTQLAAGSADGEGPFVATAGYQRRVRAATRGLVERTIDALRADFPELGYTVSTTWPWTDPAPPSNRDFVEANVYVTNKPVFPGYFELFENGDAWFGRVRDDVAYPLLRRDAQPYDDWLAEVGGGWRDLYWPQCYLGLYLDPERYLDFFAREFERGEPAAREVVTALLDEAARSAAEQGIPWYLGEGYANNPPTTSLWNQSPQSLAFHEWVIAEALRRGANGLTPTTMASPEHPDVWAEADWLRSANAMIGKEAAGTGSIDRVA